MNPWMSWKITQIHVCSCWNFIMEPRAALVFLRNRELYNNFYSICQDQFEQMTKFLSFLLFYCLLFSTKIRIFISVLCLKQRVITKAYGVQATTIEGQLKMLLLLCCALCTPVSFTWRMVKTYSIRSQVVEGPNARDQSASCAFHTFLVEVQTNAGYIHVTHV